MQKHSSCSNAVIKKPIYTRWWFWLILAFLVIGGISYLIGGGTQKLNVDNSENTGSSQESNTNTKDPNLESKSNAESSQNMSTSNGSNYTGPKFEVYYESDWKQGDTNPKIIDLYAEIDKTSDSWNEQVKTVLTYLSTEYSEYTEITFKVFNDVSVIADNQTNFTYLIATYSQPSGTITWYPDGGNIYAEQVDEEWHPQLSE